MPNQVEKQLGNYRLVRPLGWSKFAEVYLAKNSLLGTDVAIKVLQVQVAEDELEDFSSAARRMTELMHPHIIRVLEVGMEEQLKSSTPFLVMDYAPNGTLRQRHPIGTRLTLATILSYVKQIAEALHYAHLRNFIHCDVKPENILLGSNEQLLLGDFSTALISSSIKRPVGTIAYMAPEQIRGEPGPLSDEYALGAVVYEWLCGELPFYGSLSEISNMHLFGTPPPLRAIVPAIPPAIEETVLIALAKDPGRRFANVLAFANALEQATQLSASAIPSFESGLATAVWVPPVVGTPQSSAASTRSSRTRRISRRAVIVGVPTLVVAGGGILTWLLYRKKSPATFALSPTYLTYRGHAGRVTAVAWSPNGKYIASGGDDHTIQIWNALTGSRLLISQGHSGGVPAVAWSPDSTLVASASAGPSISGGPASDNTVQVWNAATGQSIYAYHGHSSGITDVAWSPKGDRVASSSSDYTVQVWDATTGQHPLILRTHSWYEWTVAWSPDGKRLASGGPDDAIRIWDAVTGNILYTYHSNAEGVTAVAWSSDGTRIASTSSDFTVRVWEATGGNTLQIDRGHTGFVTGVAWSPNGKYLASSGNDKTVLLWDATSGKTISTYSGHTGAVGTLTWSPDSKYIASGSEDGTVQIWQIPS
ncbi:MAG: serine/threonine-protein kinase [Ktedonobacteraceae bacterium]